MAVKITICKPVELEGCFLEMDKIRARKKLSDFSYWIESQSCFITPLNKACPRNLFNDKFVYELPIDGDKATNKRRYERLKKFQKNKRNPPKR